MVSRARAGQALLVLGFSSVLLACGETKLGNALSIEPDVMLPAAQGAGVFSLRGQSPPIQGKACPVVSLTSALPAVDGPSMLDANTYVKHIADGEGAATVSCKVSGNLRFTFEGSLQLGRVALKIQNGVLGDDRLGTADITVADAQALQGSLSSATPCSIDATNSAGQQFQVKAGSIWAAFDCPSVEQPPSSSCAASGVFVLENCEQ